MRRIKLLGMALLAVFAFGVVIAATAQAEEKEPAGLLFLSGGAPPVTMKGEVTAKGRLEVLGLLKGETITCQGTKFSATAGTNKGEETHVTLGTATVDYTGCKFNEKIACSSENIAGEKDPKETILQALEDTDIHFVSLLNETKLLAGVLVGLLELSKEGKKLDLTINCGGTKLLVLGATFLDVLGVNAKEDNTTVEITPTKLSCDENDKLCKEQLAAWGVTATKENESTKKDEKVFCPLGTFIEKEEECADLSLAKAIPVEISPMVLIDF